MRTESWSTASRARDVSEKDRVMILAGDIGGYEFTTGEFRGSTGACETDRGRDVSKSWVCQP